LNPIEGNEVLGGEEEQWHHERPRQSRQVSLASYPLVSFERDWVCYWHLADIDSEEEHVRY